MQGKQCNSHRCQRPSLSQDGEEAISMGRPGKGLVILLVKEEQFTNGKYTGQVKSTMSIDFYKCQPTHSKADSNY